MSATLGPKRHEILNTLIRARRFPASTPHRLPAQYRVSVRLAGRRRSGVEVRPAAAVHAEPVVVI